MMHNFQEKLWLTEAEVARLTGISEGGLRNWRTLDTREGRGSLERPGRGGLVWRRFGRSVRYWRPSLLAGEAEPPRAA